LTIKVKPYKTATTGRFEMDANAATIIAGFLGAVIAGPTGFFVERLINRPKLRISYAEAAYEDKYTFPAESVRGLLSIDDFLEFAGTLVKWSVRQRVTANLFTLQELRHITEFGKQYLDYLNALAETVDRDVLPDLERGGKDLDGQIPDLEPTYAAIYKDRSLTDDLATDHPAALQRLINAERTASARYKSKAGRLRDFLNLADESLKQGRGISDRVVIRVSIGNSGYQDAVINTEGRVKALGKTFKAPIQISSRPWDLSEARGLSQFYVLNPKAFLVLDFVLDENLNARSDLNSLKSDLQQGTNVVFEAVKLGGETAASHSFRARLP
jgi:hypothetical protein